MSGRLKMAAEYAEKRMAALVKHMDEASDPNGAPPLGGGTLSRQDFQSLLMGDPQFQQSMGARMLFANEDEKASLKRAIERGIAELEQRAAMAPPALPAGPTGPPTPEGGMLP